VELALTILGLIVSIGVAIWQHRRATLAERKNEELLRDLPKQVADELAKLGHLAAPLGPAESEVSSLLSAAAADVNGDGVPEVLVQFPVGAHGSALQVFGVRGSRFELMGELASGTPEGFDVEDYDGDGRLEVVARETDWSAGEPYATAPRITVYYRLGPRGFIEVSRRPDRTNHSA